MNKNVSKIIIIIILLGMIANIGLSTYIEVNKNINTDKLKTAEVENCFIGEGGCATVQTSVYADAFFGISNPLLGIYVFSLLSIAFLIRALSFWIKPVKKWMKAQSYWFDSAILTTMVSGTAFSIWLLYVQFFLLKATCIYCLWVDGIMIGATILFFFVKE